MRWVITVLLALAGCGTARPLVDGRASDEPYHPSGIADPASPDFHGRLIVQLGYNLPLCQGCHGTDYAGGLSGSSCLTCHRQGPESCTTCHDTPPATGAHVAHAVGGALALPLDCTQCHLKPLLYTDAGHLFAGDGTVLTGPAAIVFGPLAGAALPSVARAAPPTWDRRSGTCGNVYCHGAVLGDAAARHTAPSWSGGPAEAPCGACHGIPPADHASARCADCHGQVIDAQGRIIDRARHVDGLVSLGDESGGCTACHGGLAGPAPPRDLSGHTDESAVGVGAHAAHLLGAHRLSSPVPCGACHLVPSALHSPGHIDSPWPAEVFPPSVAAGNLAFADGASPTWDRDAVTCSNVYCHGGGALLEKDAASTVRRSPGWTLGASQAECGSCHGVPPVDAAHDPSMTLADCARCHGGSVDAFGAIKFTGGATTHLDGVVDVALP